MTAKELGIDIERVTPDLLEALGVEILNEYKATTARVLQENGKDPADFDLNTAVAFSEGKMESIALRNAMNKTNVFGTLVHGLAHAGMACPDCKVGMAGVLENMAMGFRIAIALVETDDLTKQFALLAPDKAA